MYDMGIGCDLKELWDSDMDSTNLDLKFACDSDMHDGWNPLERDAKMPQVIFNDKLMTDALLGGGMPIKSEHSYSLKSDGDSMPDSPCSLHDDDKMDDDMDDCYPSVMLASRHHSTNNNHHQNTTTNSSNHHHHATSSHPAQQQHQSTHNQPQPPIQLTSPAAPAHPLLIITGGTAASITSSSTSCIASAPNSSSPNRLLVAQQSTLRTNQIRSTITTTSATTSSSSILNANTHDHSSNSNSSDDIDVDDSTVKDEPLSPGSSCPPSPSSSYDGDDQPDDDDDTDLLAFSSSGEMVFEHKNGVLPMQSNPAQRLKGQSIVTSFQPSSSASSSPTAQQRVAIPKLNIKMEPQHSSAFGLPPTPPSSMSSDDSEGNQSPGRHEVPMSPPSATKSGRRASSVHSNSSSPSSSRGGSTGGYIGTSSRQPIHTPLISSQPKGSTGSLLLTEEEKRTLQAEGYPIPTRLPLTKAEEKSLKKIRRKIKNKISAQESRRKKKEYMDQLERKVEILVAERNNYQQAALTYQKRTESLELANEQTTKRVQSLEASNAALTGQLSKYQALIKTLNKMKQ